MKTRIVTADPFPVVLLGLRTALAAYTIVGEAADGGAATELCKQHLPDILIADYQLPRKNAIALCASLARVSPQTRLIAFSYDKTEEAAWACIKAGARGFILKSLPLRTIFEAVESVLAGNVTIIPALKNTTFKARDIDRLSERQLEVLQLISEGQTTKGTARVLKVSPKTVEFHRARLMETLNIWDIPGLVRFAARNGMVSL